jgi:hypothetical protein
VSGPYAPYSPGMTTGPTPARVRDADLWAAATRHPFLDAVRDGALPPGAFATWLAQDALFVADLLVFRRALRHGGHLPVGAGTGVPRRLDLRPTGGGDDVEVVEHWTSPEFAGYVAALDALADRAAADLVDPGLLREVLRQEAAFWDMAVPREAAS